MDAFKSEYWNLTQVIAWVLLRDRTIVRQADDSVWDFDTAEPPNDLTFAWLNAFKGYPYFQSYEEAERQIINKLCAGKADASGVPNGKGDIRPINSRRWADLVFQWNKGRKPYAAPPRFDRAGTTEWTGIKIPRKQVMKLWPSAHAAKPPDPTRHDELEKPLPAPIGEPLSEEDALLKNRIEMVLAPAKRLWPDASKSPSWRQMAAKVHAETRVSKTGFSKETIRKILSNRYPPMRRFGIDGLY